jgi:hypothetical protein
MFKLVMLVGNGVRKPSDVMRLAKAALEVVVEANQYAMREARRKGKPLPPLYSSGVRYQREPWRHEEFADALTVLKRKWGDCDDLVPYRVAELREAGEAAKIRLYRRRNKRSGNTVHVQVRRAPSAEFPRGRIEDPSRLLGM